MRVIVFFDLPVLTGEQRRAYRIFRKKLIREGFIMMQESVYCKLVITPSMADLVKNKVNKISPKEGKIQMLIITEKQYAAMSTIIGDVDHPEIDTTERLLVL